MSKYHFDITPHIVKQLGDQLVSDEITALLELIKNSYDADATYVSIEINTSGQYLKDELFYKDHKGFIVVEDDGFGMNEDTILKSWLLISYSKKREKKKMKGKTPMGRTPLGEKGLGRLSTQRLADICEIFTWEDQKEGIHLGFDWTDFDKVEALGDVPIQRRVGLPSRQSSTKLILANLKHAEVWEGKNLEKFKGLISEIISPYSKNKPFEVFLTVNDQKIELEKSVEELEDLAISKFDFKFENGLLTITGRTKMEKFIGQKKDDYQHYLLPDGGKKFLNFIKSKEKYKDITQQSLPYFIGFQEEFDFNRDIPGLELINGERANPGDFFGKIDEYSFDNWLSEDEGLKSTFGKLGNYKLFVQSQTGVKIYRNGFAVKPFGLGDDKDWLGLSESQTRTSFYDLRPNNVVGYIAIDEGVNDQLKDKTDREGLISNPYTRNFFLIAHYIKDVINRYQRKIRQAYDRDFLSTYKTENSGIKTVSQAFNQLKETSNRTQEVRKDFDAALKTVKETISKSENIVADVKTNPLFSTDLEKEIADQVQSILRELRGIQITLQRLESVVSRTERLNEVINILEPKIEILEEQLEKFSELASLGLTTESISHEFATIADRLAEKASFYSTKLQGKKLTESDIYVLMEYINSTANGLKIQLRHLDPALKYSREKKASFTLSNFFNNEKEYYDNRFAKQEILFEIECLDDFTIKMNQGKFTQVIDNLLSNSEYWLNERKFNDEGFKPKITVKIEEPWLYVYDNGYGISPAIQNQIFEPFVTTKPKGEGRGLGLFIIRQLLDSSGCSIILEETENDSNRRFIFALNLSNITTN